MLQSPVAGQGLNHAQKQEATYLHDWMDVDLIRYSALLYSKYSANERGRISWDSYRFPLRVRAKSLATDEQFIDIRIDEAAGVHTVWFLKLVIVKAFVKDRGFNAIEDEDLLHQLASKLRLYAQNPVLPESRMFQRGKRGITPDEERTVVGRL